jgi:transposase-like protein
MDQSGNPLPESKKRGAPRGNKRALGNPGGGRKPKFKPAFIGVARKACERGFTDQEVADLLGINASTFYRWRVQYPQFARVVRLGKEMADARVERSLYERAVGYTFEAQKAVRTRHGQEILRWREHLPPDVGAATAYLKNRRPDRWRATHRIEHTSSPYDHIESAARPGRLSPNRLVHCRSPLRHLWWFESENLTAAIGGTADLLSLDRIEADPRFW